jgi:hypothetical protein
MRSPKTVHTSNRRFYETGKLSGMQPKHPKPLRMLMAVETAQFRAQNCVRRA